MKMFYFTDAMCSWCYGFSPVVKKLKENHPEIDLQIISGGFSPGSKQVVTEEYKDFLEYHWTNVNLRSGQYFDHSMKFVSDTFRYDTEPSSCALTGRRGTFALVPVFARFAFIHIFLFPSSIKFSFVRLQASMGAYPV